MQTRERLTALASIDAGLARVVSVYLDTRWADEHQRERARIFLKDALRRARAAASARPEDLAWIEEEGGRIVAQTDVPAAGAVALFACATLGLREVVPLRGPCAPAFVVADRPFLTPLARLLGRAEPAVVAVVDGRRARLLSHDGAEGATEVTLDHDVPGRHARGGWAQLAQSRYQRHLEAHRDRHFAAVGDALDAAALERGAERIVLAGDPRAVALFREQLPARLVPLVAGTIAASLHEPASDILDRAAEQLAEQDRERAAAMADAVLIEAAKGGRAVAGLGPVLVMIARGAIDRLYLTAGMSRPGCTCRACGAMQEGAGPCRVCGAATTVETDLGDALVSRVVDQGGTAEILEAHDGLARAGGVAARLRFTP